MSVMRTILSLSILVALLLTGCNERSGEPLPQGSAATAPDETEIYTVVPFTPGATASPIEPTLAATQAPATATATPGADTATPTLPPPVALETPLIIEYPVPAGSRPHDVAPDPASDIVWYTAQRLSELGRLVPSTGETRHIALGSDSAPHGVIVGLDGAPWVTDGGLNAIVRVDPVTEAVNVYPLPASTINANLNTATFDDRGILWFTGQSGFHGRLDPATGQVEVFASPRGRGPYGIDSTPDGSVYFTSLAGSYLGFIDLSTGDVTELEPPTPDQGARRVWSDSTGVLWISEWNAGQLGRFDPRTGTWREWRLPGNNPMPYAVYVDEFDLVWLSDFGANAMVRFDPATESFTVFPLPSSPANVRQILGRPGEIWGAESGVDKLVVLRTIAP